MKWIQKQFQLILNLLIFVMLSFFYHENSNYLLFQNSERHIEIMGDDFPIDKTKFNLKSKYITPFTGGNGRYREYIDEVF